MNTAARIFAKCTNSRTVGGGVALTAAIGVYFMNPLAIHSDASTAAPSSKMSVYQAAIALAAENAAKQPKQPKQPPPSPEMSVKMAELVTRLQRELTSAAEGLEREFIASTSLDGTADSPPATFFMDSWKRKEGGYGTSAVLQDGVVFEKAGVNISIIRSPAPPAMLKHMRSRKPDNFLDPSKTYEMFVAGLSTVMHPRNPLAPTFHANYRYFELRETGSDTIASSWFGGGCDLTPAYVFDEDSQQFHSVIKSACDAHNPTFYSRFKAWCDQYFRNTHRNEGRGIGGIFFDDLDGLEDGLDKEALFNFVKDCGESMAKQYIPIVRKRMLMPFTPAQKQWQQLRRGRYVEFNLVHDRGTKFGLVTPGVRIESVLMSLPLTARWEYNGCKDPEPGSWEERTLEILKTPQEWVKA